MFWLGGARSWGAWLSVLAVLVPGAVLPAGAVGSEPPQWAICGADGQAALATLEATLSPANGVSVTVGTPVVFSGSASQPVSFAVASSAALLTSPDIDAGAGVLQSSGTPATYAFSSAKAGGAPGTVYWQASFSDAGIPACAGLTPRTLTTQARSLSVVAVPSPTLPTPSTPSPSVPVLPGSGSVGVSVLAPAVLSLAHGTLRYGVRCTTECSGETGYRLLLLGAHRARPVSLAGLGFAERVSIKAATGGQELFAHHYRAGALRRLRELQRAGDTLEVSITAQVNGATGGTARVQRMIRLHA